MKSRTKSRLRFAGALLVLTGIGVFLSSLPSQLPPEEIAARKAEHAEWTARHNQDLVMGRASSAGPEPNSSAYTPMSSGRAIAGLLICLLGVIVVLQTLM